jgi:hypothetical protein
VLAVDSWVTAVSLVHVYSQVLMVLPLYWNALLYYPAVPLAREHNRLESCPMEVPRGGLHVEAGWVNMPREAV